MTDLLFNVRQPYLPVVGDPRRFPVRRIYCVGRNYAEHIREFGYDPEREEPFFFQKPADAVVANNATIPYPTQTGDLHHEAELVMAIGREGADVPPDAATDCIFGFAVGVDLTRRDLQAAAKKRGRPWESAKAFDNSAPCSALTPLADCGLLERGAITLAVNAESRQRGDLGQMIWSPLEIVAQLSKLFRLLPGDLIMTGTPAGVGPLAAGDSVVVRIEGLETLRFAIES